MLILACSSVCQAQNVLRGTVSELDTKEVLPGAFVYVYDGQHILKYAVCGDDGSFSVAIDSLARPDHIVVSFIGFKSASVPVRDTGKPLNVQLQPQKMELNGAVTTASALEIHSDTLSYIASAFADGSERSVGDLIGKLPGLAVTKSGGITYQGVPINKFYVEGMDLMNSSYGVVTNNLSADKIARVEVYKNHQPKRVLVGIKDSDRSAVNLILKESAKNTLMITGDLAAGAGEKSFLFDGKAMLTRFSPSMQDLILVKGNDIGRNVISEIAAQQYFGRTGAVLVSDENIDSDFQSRLNPTRTVLPIPQEYWYNNISGVASFNHLKKINDGLLLRGSLHIAGEKYSEESFSTEEIHFNEADSLIIEEDRRMTDTKYFFSGNFAIEKNSDSNYLSDIVTVSGQLRKDDGLLAGGAIDKTQFYKLPSLKIENNLDITTRTGENMVLEIKSDTKYVRNSHQADYKTGQLDAHQMLYDNSAISLNSISTNLRASIFQINLGGGVNLDYQSFNSRLSGVEDLPVPSSVLSEFADISPNVFLSGSTRFRRNTFSFRVPVEYHFITGNARSGYLSFKPNARFESNLSSLWKIKAGASYSQKRNDMGSMLPAVVMGNYRSLSVSGGLMKYRDTDVDAGLEYSNDIRFAYASISGVYHKSWTDKSGAQLYSRDLTISTYTSAPVTSDNYGVRGALTKYFGLKVFVVKINGGYMRDNQNFYLQGIFQSYKTDRYDANIVMRVSPVSWLSLEAEADYAHSRVFGDYDSRHRSLTTKAALSVTPVKSLVFNFNAFWMKENTINQSVSNTPLIKIDAAWTVGHFTITAECRNVLNSKEFKRSYVDTFRSSSYCVSMPGLQALVGIRLSL